MDRRALPTPEAGCGGAEGPYEAPQTPTEEVLAGIWAEALGRDRVGMHDHFFGLGGHSLLAMQLMSRIRATLKVDLPLRSLFEAPTVAELAERIEAVGERDDPTGQA
ncbi:MAG: hypothetical protein K6V73_06505 [Firmicutes bacterium]|nr:hypothetical protein [Bacillota bacterium]